MKRDLDLIRRIMTDIEDLPAGERYTSTSYPGGYDVATVYHHIRLLIDEKLVEGHVVDVMRAMPPLVVTGLTWKGHDFVDAARNDSVWAKAKETVLRPTVSFTFDLLRQWLIAYAKQPLGLS